MVYLPLIQEVFMSNNYLEINRRLWDERVGHHVSSGFYKMDDFMKGRSSLNDIELPLLGDVSGKKILHLQCHFGQDTLSLARMGAQVTGVDFSEKAIEKANELNQQLGLDARFLCCDIYELPQYLDEQFDIVFTSYGTIGWLPDVRRWALVVATFLATGGTFIIADFHPFVWMYNETFSEVKYAYFNKEAIEETETGTYTDKNAPIELQSVGWNHNFAEIIQSLLDEGLQLEVFAEYDYSPYNVFGEMTEMSGGHFQIKGLEGKLPLVYALKMSKLA